MNVSAQSSCSDLIRMRALLIFAVTFFSYAYFYEGAGWNQNSRFDLVRAIIEQRTLRIDDFQQNTGDKAFANGHYYSDKAPGLALLAVPAAWAGRGSAASFGSGSGIASWLVATCLLERDLCGAIALRMAAACACLFWISLQLGSSVTASAFAALALGLATPMWAYAALSGGAR